MSHCQALLDAGATQTGNLSTHTVGEYYTSGVIGAMIDEGSTFTALQIDPSRMHVLGTPTQLVEWCVRQRAAPACRICFDIDNTLLTPPRTPGDYSTCVPIAENVAACKAFFEQGHTIILQTERGLDAHGGNAGAAVADVAAATLASLRAAGIAYHEIHFGKPLADFYVDDRAVTSAAQLHKEIGHYPNSGYTATPPAPKPAAAVAPAEPPARSRGWTSIGLALLVGGVCGAAISTLRPR